MDTEFRPRKYYQAIHEALDVSLANDPAVYIMGLGATDPKGTFGTTVGLAEKYNSRVLDMPVSENGMTGVAIGSALAGMRPVLTHQRLDFALLAIEQMVNQAANWHYMYGGKMKMPLLIRLLIGRGWGQGPQHSQSLHSWFAHIPGLKVIAPATPYDAKGLTIASIQDNNPVISIEHRWLYNIEGNVPNDSYQVPIGQARVVKEGTDLTIVTLSYMTVEAIKAANQLEESQISAEVIDLRSLNPIDWQTISKSVTKTRRLIVVDMSWQAAGIASEIVAAMAERHLEKLACAPVRLTHPPCPSPSSPELARYFYPRAPHIVAASLRLLGKNVTFDPDTIDKDKFVDIPDSSFSGPF